MPLIQLWGPTGSPESSREELRRAPGEFPESPQRAPESHREPQRAPQSPRELRRASESPGDPWRVRENFGEPGKGPERHV
eukprot:9299064-Alexandrium_andersonii.AAC.1